METLIQNKDAIIGIIDTYKRQNGTTNWKKAINEKPELIQLLGIDTKKGKQKLYAYTCKIRREILGTKISTTKIKSRQTNGSITETNCGSLKYVKYCACCGSSLEAMDLALRLSKGEK